MSLTENPFDSQFLDALFSIKDKLAGFSNPISQTKVMIPIQDYFGTNIGMEDRLLIPYSFKNKIGFVDKHFNLVVKAKYDMYYGECYKEGDCIKVEGSRIEIHPRASGNHEAKPYPVFGMLNSKGEEVLPLKFKSIVSCGLMHSLFVVKRLDDKFAVVNASGKETVPYGKYDCIDSYHNGYARVIKGHKAFVNFEGKGCKLGIIDEDGKEILPLEYDNIWNFKKGDYSTVIVIKNGRKEQIPFRVLDYASIESIPLEKAFEKWTRDMYEERKFNEEQEAWEHYQEYQEYEGYYAQDVMGYSDGEIGDAFDGDPDAYWNID